MSSVLAAAARGNLSIFYVGGSTIFIGVVSLALEVWINDLYRTFYDSLAARELAPVLVIVSYFLLANIAVSFCFAARSYLGEYLDATLRYSLSLLLFEKAIAGSLYGQNSVVFSDQRIAEDVEIFTSRFGTILINFVLMFLKSAVFFGILWHSSPIIEFFGFPIAGSISILAVVYFAMPTAANYFLGGVMARLEDRRRHSEARLRLSLVAIFQDGLLRKRHLMYLALTQTFRISVIALKSHTSVTFINSLVAGLAFIVPMIILIPAYFSRQIELGDLVKQAAAFTILQNSLGYLYANFREFIRCLSAYRRLNKFYAAISEHNT